MASGEGVAQSAAGVWEGGRQAGGTGPRPGMAAAGVRRPGAGEGGRGLGYGSWRPRATRPGSRPASEGPYAEPGTRNPKVALYTLAGIQIGWSRAMSRPAPKA